MSLADSIDEWVGKELEKVEPQKVRSEKIIRDALQDSYVFKKHEINIIDTPIIQRLRKIHQTAFAFLTYPTANHTRFDHTLGVTIIADKLINSLKNKHEDIVEDSTINEVRLAAILHDCGHGPFSHISEYIYSQLPEVYSELHANPKFSKCEPKAHEMISYMIVSSGAFKNFVEDVVLKKTYGGDNIHINMDNVADMIVGGMDNPNTDGYMSDIINGVFDADKLDYIQRDAYFTGLKLGVDVDRILYTILIDTRQNEEQRIIVDISGAPSLEQVLFNKILLYSSIYHHHKIRTTECMLKSVFEITKDNDLEVNGLSFDKVIDFLSIADDDILSTHGKHSDLSPILRNISNRKTLKRALVISKKTIAGEDVDMSYERLVRLSEKPEMIKHLRKLIVSEMKTKCSAYDVWVDLPRPPSLREASQCKVRITDDDYETLDKIFPIDRWLKTYAENKWQGYVFCPSKKETREDVSKATEKVFEHVFGITFKPTAKTLAKIF